MKYSHFDASLIACAANDNFGISGTVVLCTAAGLVAAERLARGVKTAGEQLAGGVKEAGEQLTGGLQEAATTVADPMAELATTLAGFRPAVDRFADDVDGIYRGANFFNHMLAEPWPYKLLPYRVPPNPAPSRAGEARAAPFKLRRAMPRRATPATCPKSPFICLAPLACSPSSSAPAAAFCGFLPLLAAF